MLAFRLDLLSVDAISGHISSHQYEYLKFSRLSPRKVSSARLLHPILLRESICPALSLARTLSSAFRHDILRIEASVQAQRKFSPSGSLDRRHSNTEPFTVNQIQSQVEGQANGTLAECSG